MQQYIIKIEFVTDDPKDQIATMGLEAAEEKFSKIFANRELAHHIKTEVLPIPTVEEACPVTQ